MVGGGHNGLTAAAYLARAGSRVLVPEARERLGGACTLERPFGDECGAATHPAGSVIALNGRNAAEAVLADARRLSAA